MDFLLRNPNLCDFFFKLEKEAQERPYGPGKDTVLVHSSGAQDLFQWAISTQEGGPHCLKGQWQEYLKTVLHPISGWGASQWPDPTMVILVG